jgi:hypothetical protein
MIGSFFICKRSFVKSRIIAKTDIWKVFAGLMMKNKVLNIKI